MARHGVRAEWESIPDAMRRQIAAIAGAEIRSAENMTGGFSPGPAARCTLADGRSVFVKAAGRELNPFCPDMHRREAEVMSVLPPDAPCPDLIGVADDGDWVALVITWVDGAMPIAPLVRHEVDRLLGLVDRLAAVELDDRSQMLLQPFAEAHAELMGNWGALRADPLVGLDGWSIAHLDDLAEIEAHADAASRGTHLLHFDLRTDNVLLARDGPEGDVIVDWPHAAVGAPWIDLICLLPSLHLDGGPLPDEVLEQHRVGRSADPEAVDAIVVALAGYFTRLSLMPPPPGLPTVRRFQAAQAAITRNWISRRRGWAPG